MLVLGAGPGGYSAAFRSADIGMKTVLVERYATLGGVCLNVGCIPSKALLHTASVMDEVKSLSRHGIKYTAPEVDVDALRGFKDGVVKKLTGGLAGMAKARKVEVVTGVGSFLDPHHVEVTGVGGAKKVVKFAKAIIAAGSQAMKLPFMPDDERVVDSTGALLLKDIPKRMLVVGGGIIGLEMATVYSTLGTRIDVVEMLDGLMQGADRDLVKVWEKVNAARFDNVMLKTKTVGAKATKAGIEVRFEGEKAPGTAAALRPGARRRRPQPERQEDRRRQGRRRRHRARLHRRRPADAHQRAAHLRHRRHRRPADARPQGGPRSARRGGSRPWRGGVLRRAPDPVGRLYRP
jgi:dihydrolipoamide dehydrogenase